MTSFESPLIPTWIQAQYTAQDNPPYQGNPLIEALPPTLDDSAILDALAYMPPCGPDERSLPAAERFHRLLDLKNFLIPLERHLELYRAIDMMIRGGYVGRSPNTVETAK